MRKTSLHLFADESRSLQAGFVDGSAVGTKCPDVEYALHHMTKVGGKDRKNSLSLLL